MVRQVDSASSVPLLAAPKMTAEEIYESVTNGGSTDFAQVADILQRHGPWSLIGGLPLNCYVEPVYTVDADIGSSHNIFPRSERNSPPPAFGSSSSLIRSMRKKSRVN